MKLESAGELRSDSPAELPAIDFTVAHGQKEQVFLADGSVQDRISDRKFDSRCKNAVSLPDGSIQGFDGNGLCKVRGKVHWGKASPDGVMEITLGENTKIKLDAKWQLLSVKSEKNNYDKQTEDAKAASAREQKSREAAGTWVTTVTFDDFRKAKPGKTKP